MKKLKAIDVALYIFILTGLGYFITFSYGWGYNNYFFIPTHFIDLSVINITRSISLLGVSISTFLVFTIFFLDKTDFKSLFSGARKFIFESKFKFLFQFLCIVGLVVMVVFIKRESITQIKIIYFFEGLVYSSIYFYLKKYSKATYVTLAVVLLMLPYIFGLVNAKTQTEFFIIDNNEDYLIITFNDNKIISAKFDSTNNIIFPEFKILSMDNLVEYEKNVRLIKINKLTVAEPIANN